MAALDEAAADGPVEILFWHGMSNELGRELERIVGQFNASQDRVEVRLEFQGGYEQTIDKYLQSDTDNRPDLVQMPEYTVQLMVDTQSNVPVQACMEDAGYDPSGILPTALDAYATESIQWAMPFNVSNPVLYYNKKVFRDAGLDPEAPPLTLEQLGEYGRTIQSTGAASYGVAFDSAPDGGGGWFLEQWLAKEGEFYSDNDNGRSAPSTRVLFDGPTGVELLTGLQDDPDDRRRRVRRREPERHRRLPEARRRVDPRVDDHLHLGRARLGAAVRRRRDHPRHRRRGSRRRPDAEPERRARAR